MPVVGPPIGVKGAKQAALANHLVQRGERTQGAFLGNEYRRIDLTGGVIHCDDQIPPLLRITAQPLMAGAVLMQHHAWQGTTLPLAPVCPPARRLADPAMTLQGQAKPVVAVAKAVSASLLYPFGEQNKPDRSSVTDKLHPTT